MQKAVAKWWQVFQKEMPMDQKVLLEPYLFMGKEMYNPSSNSEILSQDVWDMQT